ncbi:hypothetical protein BCAR13_270014 [Paraburkholderia caribensis]|nr:hypothetical protein BCAR13_270014 [Paraburkholderia caribensis]
MLRVVHDLSIEFARTLAVGLEVPLKPFIQANYNAYLAFDGFRWQAATISRGADRPTGGTVTHSADRRASP